MGGVLGGLCRRRARLCLGPTVDEEEVGEPHNRPLGVEDLDLFKVNEKVLAGFIRRSDATTHGPTKRLAKGIAHRSFTYADQVKTLIQQGADPNAAPILWAKDSRGKPYLHRIKDDSSPLLSLAVDNYTHCGMSHHATSFLRPDCEVGIVFDVVLPNWSSAELQRDILHALLDGGADINRGDYTNGPATVMENKAIRVAVRGGNVTAVGALLARNSDLHGSIHDHVIDLACLYVVPPRPQQYENALLTIYRLLLQHDPTIATHTPPHVPVIGTCMESGVNLMAMDSQQQTPLHTAAFHASFHVADYLCRHSTVDDINRGTPKDSTNTPLACAARELDMPSCAYRALTTVRVLLRGGAAPSLTRMSTATHEHRRRQLLVVDEYKSVLNELPDVVITAINAALAPHRDHSMLLARLLPLAPHHDGAHPHPSPSNMAFGPHEAEGIAWKVGAFLHEPSAASAAIDEYLIGDSQLRRRVKAAVGHFVKSAATRTSSNREVVGGTRYEQQGDKRVKVTVPPL
ncbi:unnamed protein product [Vitrella brassicaformis CCMP3155]|uniref:Uncharacterized protein n=1 Tax=Vitrella brassicaformis (strain CCMP3155) TaxID=1169540 RepID=A0A0G4EQL1_VITBC|nr:unnamed protein product [Vitrella brassicaformis CCMP3155]|eukprot:CEM00513.1 unnamed protein product [Vitrella brassicaformis CCMP3155]